MYNIVKCGQLVYLIVSLGLFLYFLSGTCKQCDVQPGHEPKHLRSDGLFAILKV